MKRDISVPKGVMEDIHEDFSKFIKEMFSTVEFSISGMNCNRTIILGKNSIIYNILADSVCSFMEDDLISLSGLTIEEFKKSTKELIKMGLIETGADKDGVHYNLAHIDNKELIEILDEYDEYELMFRYRKVIEDNDFVIDIEKLKAERYKYFNRE